MFYMFLFFLNSDLLSDESYCSLYICSTHLFFLNLLRDIFYKYAMLFGGVSIDKVSGA